MLTDKRELIYKYLQELIAQADFRVKAYVFNERNEKNPTRNCFVKLKMHLNTYLGGNSALRWLMLPGFRGVGKTTLLAQLYYETTQPNIYKLFLSVDEIVQILGISLSEVLQVYEEVIGKAFERLDKPVIIFLDEVHYDPKWAITLKTIFDRTNKVFMITTGSSALTMQKNPDVARRAYTEKLYPMSFTEYMKITHGKFEIPGLAQEIRASLYQSVDAQEVFQKLQKTEQRVKKYWLGIERQEIERYMRYGTLPFTVRLQNEGLAYDQIKKIIDKVIGMDVLHLGKFESQIILKIPETLYILSSSEKVSITNLAKDLSINKNTLADILDVLEKTELIVRIYPYGAHGTQVRKPSKYLFASPAFRSMYFHFIGNIITPINYTGKLLEDTIGLYITKFVTNNNASLTYDSAAKGADFIMQLLNSNIILEAGYSQKGISQIQNTAVKVKAKYGLSIAMSQLLLGNDKKTVVVPLSYFLLT